MKTPTLPAHFAFDLALARHGWPLVTRDGLEASIDHADGYGAFPLIGTIKKSYGRVGESWTLEGKCYRGTDTDGDLFLSADTTDPLLRRAVEAAEKAGILVSYKWQSQDWRPHPIGCEDHWDWEMYSYLPTRLLSQLPKPEPASEIAPVHNPDKLTVAQVGEGWFLPERGMPMRGDQYWNAEDKSWKTLGAFGSDYGLMLTHVTYRRPLPAPVAPWSKPSDLGFPWPLMKHKDRPRLNTITSADKDGLKIEGWGNVAWSEIRNWLHSRDGINFIPCTK
jgi:hypothetical protein